MGKQEGENQDLTQLWFDGFVGAEKARKVLVGGAVWAAAIFFVNMR
jgi:hypothetical protein